MSFAIHLLVGAVGGGLCAALFATRDPSARGIPLAVCLAVAAGIYVGYGLVDGRTSQGTIQVLGALPFIMVAATCPRAMAVLGFGWMAHGLWDGAHALGMIGTEVPPWYPGVCLGWDVVLGIAALIWAADRGRDSGNRPGARMRIRPVNKDDASGWLRLRCAFWPGAEGEHELNIGRFFDGTLELPAQVLVAEEAGSLVGLVELSIRAYAEGCDSNHVGYVEGWYVDPAERRRGVGRALIAAAEDWARGAGCTELASDAELTNSGSDRAHRACGFEETGRIRCYRKILDDAPDSGGRGSET